MSDRLTAYAVRLFASARLLGPEAAMKGVGASPEDLAADTIVKVLAEEGIKYRSSKGPLIPFLAKVMLNDFRDLLRKAAYKRAVDAKSETEKHAAETLPHATTAHHQEARDDDPLHLSIEEEQKGRIRHLLGNEPDLRDVVDAVLELNCKKPSEIAEVLRVPSTEVQNRKKKLRKRLTELYARRRGVSETEE